MNVLPSLAARHQEAVELTIVVPTFNECENVRPLLDRLDRALGRIEWEVIYVDDDSPDGTASRVRTIAQRDYRVRCIQRIGRRGLSSAVIEGMLASSAPYLAVLDGDLQHDETLLPAMLAKVKSDKLDIVVGSRYLNGGGLGEWSHSRAVMSAYATRFARLLITTDLTDPMSGYFLVTREAFERSVRRLSGHGFKILLDLFVSTPTPYRFGELPYVFRTRTHGSSKFDEAVIADYLSLLLDKLVGHYIPVRFVLFVAVGTVGLCIHLMILRTALAVLGFGASQIIATVVAMIANFAINNALTYRDRRLKGIRALQGLLTFCAICSVGAVANVRLATAIFEQSYSWWLSGAAGAAASAVWNYAVTSIVTWRSPSSRAGLDA